MINWQYFLLGQQTLHKIKVRCRTIYGRFYVLCMLLWLLAACQRPDPNVKIVTGDLPTAVVVSTMPPASFQQDGLVSPATTAVPATPFPLYIGTPTADSIHYNPTSGDSQALHTVNSGETLGYIAQLYAISLDELLQLNEMQLTDMLLVGQQLRIPGRVDQNGPDFKLIPDSELLFGPTVQGFSVRQTAVVPNAYLWQYSQTVEGRPLEGPEIVELVALRHSVNPRLLLALLEYRAGWLSRTNVSDQAQQYPMGYVRPGSEGLYIQLSRVANELNWGFYGRAEGNLHSFPLPDNTNIIMSPTINHGTAGVQRALGSADHVVYQGWLHDVGPDGFFATYQRLFGNPFAYTFEPILPPTLSQPSLQLPWSPGETWYFTGGPHGGWNSGSAWAALDFVPGGDLLGCFDSDDWVTAMSDGVVTRSDFGAVVVDMDGDGFAGTGWAIVYMHLAEQDRIAAGSYVQTGDRLGHPSCEGGFSNGTHVHIARTYNGRWIAADGDLPFNMSGWVSSGDGREYNGYLVRGNISREACTCRETLNAILHE